VSAGLAALTRRQFLKALGAAALAGAGGAIEACARRLEEKVVSLFNWFNYIGKDTLKSFETATGIRVLYDVFGDEEEMFAKLRAGVSGYDLVVATDYMIPRLRALGLIDPVPRDLLTNLGHLAPRFRDPVYDPGLAYTIPYLWGTTGIGFNRARLGRVPSSWRALWDEGHKGRMSMLDNVRDAVGVALLLLGLPTDTRDPSQLQQARDLLVRQKPLLKRYSSTTYVDDLASGEVWLAQGWSGDVLQAARDKPAIDYVVPQEGSFIYVDSLCLTRGSEHREEALRLADHILKPEVAAEISNTVRYATPNERALPLLAPDLKGDSRIFPDAKTEARLRFYAVLDSEADELWNRVWQEVKLL
jgi:spermidine/putrescine-binding protein